MALHHLLGPFSINLFASRTNTQQPLYYSWKPDPAAKVVDAFSISWASNHPYLFPSFSMIGRALTKIQLERVEYPCLIAPAWPGQVWYQQLMKMLMRSPILLPMEEDLILSPPDPLILQGHLPLATWPISGRDTLCRGFLRELPTCSTNPGDCTHTQLTTQPGKVV